MARAVAATPLEDFPGQPLEASFDQVVDTEPWTFLETMEPIAQVGVLRSCLDRAKDTLREASEYQREHADCNLTVDGLAAIMKYTAEDGQPTFYSSMNSSCYQKERSKVAPFVPYMWLLMKSLSQLQSYTGTEVYRGVKLNLRDEYVRRKSHDKLVTYWSFTSTTKNEDVVKRFLGESEARTLFIIQLSQQQARDISMYSPLPEEEVLLPPCSQFQIGSVIDQGLLAIITLVEVRSTHWIVDLAPKEEDLQEEIRRLRKALKETKSRANCAEADRHALLTQITNMDREAEAQAGQRQKAEQYTETLNEQIEALKTAIKHGDKQIEGLSEQLQASKKAITHGDEQRETLKKAIKHCNKQIEGLNEQIEASKKGMEARDKQIEALEKCNEASNKETEALKELVGRMEQEAKVSSEQFGAEKKAHKKETEALQKEKEPIQIIAEARKQSRNEETEAERKQRERNMSRMEAEMEAERKQREAEKEAERKRHERNLSRIEAEMEAERKQREAEKEAERKQRERNLSRIEAEMEAFWKRREAEKEAERKQRERNLSRIEAEMEAERKQREAEKEAERKQRERNLSRIEAEMEALRKRREAGGP